MDNNTSQDLNLEDFGMNEMDNTPIEELTSENVDLFFIAIDSSSSMHQHVNTMIDGLVDFKSAITNSKEADHILLASARFDSDINIGGYLPIEDFSTDYAVGGVTLLRDVIVEGKERLLGGSGKKGYIDYLRDSGVMVKATFAVFSDGEDVGSTHSEADAKRAVEELNNAEIATVFIEFGQGARGISNSLGFREKADPDAGESALRNIMRVLSKSVIASSKSVVNTSDSFLV